MNWTKMPKAMEIDRKWYIHALVQALSSESLNWPEIEESYDI